jgi:hypothetical protein
VKLRRVAYPLLLAILGCADGEVNYGSYAPLSAGGSGGAAPENDAAEGGWAAAFGTEGPYSYDAGKCSSCSQSISGITQLLLCTDNGPPSSADLYSDYVYRCACKYCLDECDVVCYAGGFWPPGCKLCREANCPAEFEACKADKLPGTGGDAAVDGAAGSTQDGGTDADVADTSVD